MFEKQKGQTLIYQIFSRKDISRSFLPVQEGSPLFNTLKYVEKCTRDLLDMHHKNLSLVTKDELTLKGVFIPNESNKCYVGLHDAFTNGVRELSGEALYFYELGYNVFIPYSRAHGPSEGLFVTYGEIAADDLRKWLSFLKDEKGMNSFVLHGIGLGANTISFILKEKEFNFDVAICDSPEVSAKRIIDNWVDLRFPMNKKQNLIKEYAYKTYKELFICDVENTIFSLNINESNYPVLLLTHSLDEEKDYGEIDNKLITKKNINNSSHSLAFYNNDNYIRIIKEFVSINGKE